MPASLAAFPIKLRCYKMLLSSVLEHSPTFYKAHISDNKHKYVGGANGNLLPDEFCSHTGPQRRKAVTLLHGLCVHGFWFHTPPYSDVSSGIHYMFRAQRLKSSCQSGKSLRLEIILL